MTKTQNYNLNKPEAGDPLRLADFNQNADIIDGALSKCANIAVGSYIGDGTYGQDNPKTLTFEFKPTVVWIRCTNSGGTGLSYFSLLGFEGMKTAFIYNSVSGGSESTIHMTWGENSFTWYGTNSGYSALNNQGTKYYYLALG